MCPGRVERLFAPVRLFGAIKRTGEFRVRRKWPRIVRIYEFFLYKNVYFDTEIAVRGSKTYISVEI